MPNSAISNRFTPTIIGIFLILCVALVSCDSESIESKWVGTPISIDGNASDWQGIGLQSFENAEASFGISNDEENLFLILRFRDSQWARAMRQSGLKIWINDGQSEGKGLGVRYSDGPNMAEILEMDGRSIDEMRPEMVERFQKMEARFKNSFKFIDKPNLINSEISADGTNGPEAAFAIDQSFFVYEFLFPLGKSEVRDYGLNLTPGQEFSLVLEFGGSRERSASSRGERGGMEFSGGGRGGQGGGRGGGRGGSGGDRGSRGQDGRREQRLEKQEFSLKTALAVPEQ